MNAADYQTERKKRGTQESVAAMLGVARETLARRETGALPINREAELALLALPAKRRKRRSSNTPVCHAETQPQPKPRTP